RAGSPGRSRLRRADCAHRRRRASSGVNNPLPVVMSFTVAIVGRPNVGKSTLFNRLTGKRLALVDDLPGVTRDRREGRARLGDLAFTAIDTAGLAEAPPESPTRPTAKPTQAANLAPPRGR